MKCTATGMLLTGLLLLFLPGFSQTNTYILNGNAIQNNCNCYTLTAAENGQSGSVWNASKINLRTSFDFVFNVNLGCKDATGADGIVFILQPLSTSIGAMGGGMGFLGVAPSVGIALDTWQNQELNDPINDHISIQINGNLGHGADLAGPVDASSASANIEDCAWHTFRISWDAPQMILRGYFDDVLRVEAQRDLVSSVFNNDPLVYWGFSAATGGSNNRQQFCTALNPGFSTNLPGDGGCLGQVVTFTNTSQSFAPISSFFWDFGDGSTSTVANPAPHHYNAPGLYPVKLAITGFDGCKSDTLRKIVAIGDFPIARFQAFDTCEGNWPKFVDQSSLVVGNLTQWEWVIDGSTASSVASPQVQGLSPGPHQAQLIVTSNYGCSSAPVTASFQIKSVPVITAAALDGCVGIPLQFEAQQVDNATTVGIWDWDFGDGQRGNVQHPKHRYIAGGSMPVSLVAYATNGCPSKATSLELFINQATAYAGNDTVCIQNEPFQLQGIGNGNYSWSPSVGLTDATIANPIGTLRDDMDYVLTVTTAEGCTKEDRIHIEIFKGSAVYVPKGFTPNGDGLNDILQPYLKGIRTLGRFSIYNRWGQLLFSTKDPARGWDGRMRGVLQGGGVYIWTLSAVDYVGKVYEVKGTSMLVR